MVEAAKRFSDSKEPGTDAFDQFPAEAFVAPKKKRRRGSWWARYHQHMDSPVWAAFRKLIIAERGNKCEECGASGEKEAMHVHHRNYKRLGCEKREDVQLLCELCHRAKHPRKKRANFWRKKAA